MRLRPARTDGLPRGTTSTTLGSSTATTAISTFELSRQTGLRRKPKGKRPRIFLIYLNFLPDCLENINKNAYICIVKILKGHEAAAPNKAAYFVPTCKEIIAATA